MKRVILPVIAIGAVVGAFAFAGSPQCGRIDLAGRAAATADPPSGGTPRTAETPPGTETPPQSASPPSASDERRAPPDWSPPQPPAASERVEERLTMVKDQMAETHWTRTAVKDEAVLAAMRTVPRHRFVPERERRQAYQDSPLPIGYGQTISQPYMVAYMTERLRLKPGDRVLEIGTGSGYQAAVLSQLTPEVYTIEIIEPLAGRAAKTLREQGYADVHTRHGDGYNGWAEYAPFDAIIVTAAAGHVPPPLWEQLRPGGRMVIPIGGPYDVQRLVVLEKTAHGERTSESLMAVRFVPLTRGSAEEE